MKIQHSNIHQLSQSESKLYLITNKEVNQVARRIMDRWYMEDTTPPPPQDDQPNHIKIYYKNQFHKNYKEDEKAMRKIITEHVKTTNATDELKVIIYYKNRKTSSLIMCNNPSPQHEKLKQRNVVYQYTCPVAGCSSKYIGMTTMRLSKRISCHLQEGAIFNHLQRMHNRQIPRDQFINSIEIAGKEPDSRRLRYLEALLILAERPSINSTDEPLLLPTLIPTPTRQANPAP